MAQQLDPGKVFTTLHHRVTGELLHLMDGLYSNIEDGLFELAFRARHEQQRRRCFDLMREMRFQRSRVVQTFARRLQASCDAWLGGADEAGDVWHDAQVERLAQKCTAHFGGVLQSLAERASFALDRPVHRSHLPIGPQQVATHFIESMKALDFDEASIEIVEELFSRFVLERLGPVYGECNHSLERAGYYTASELDAVTAQAG